MKRKLNIILILLSIGFLSSCVYNDEISLYGGTEVEPTTNIWQGAKITFEKAGTADPAQAANQDRITDNVWLTRSQGGGQIYNIKLETSADKDDSPLDTEWAFGTTADIENLQFRPFRATVGNPREAVGKDLVLHLITDDIFIDVKFLSWDRDKIGGFRYERSTE